MSIDWSARLRALLYTQFRPTVWAPAIADAIGAQRQSLQGLQDAVAALWSIDPVVGDDETDHPAYGVGRGIQLDRIGRIVGQPRGAASDAVYRPMLRARILVNRSNSTGDAIIGIFVAMFGGQGSPLIIPGWVMQYTVRLVGVVMDPLLVPAAVDFLRDATQAGVRAVLEWMSAEASHQFTWDDLTSTDPDTPCATGWADLADPAAGGRWGGAKSI